MTDNLIDIQEPDRSQDIIDLVEKGLNEKGILELYVVKEGNELVACYVGMANERKAEHRLPPQHIPIEDIPSKAQDIIQSIEAAIRIARDPKGDED